MGHCPLCHTPTAAAVLAYAADLQPLVRQRIQDQHPDWSPEEGVCPSCVLLAARQQADTRQIQSLHTRTVPTTTYPYYHPRETRIRAQHERLPEHPGFSGQGITIAFLDSGYFPHIDLLEAGDLSGIDAHFSSQNTWQKESESTQGWDGRVGPANVARSRRLLERLPMRIRQYVNLLDDGMENVGLGTPSLWSDAGNSWHGQMTSTIAIGNGLLSNGLYRGFAPKAEGVLIKIGRFDGSIPESEILRGLHWLLRDRNWERHGVRVVNISVGGDYPDPWWENEVCLAVERLAQEGVLSVVAAGNSGQNRLLAPAQAPSAITVGGVDDGNRIWRRDKLEDVNRIGLYHHNWDEVYVDHWHIPKPEILAPAVWMAAPILPVSGIFREVWLLGRAWQMVENLAIDEARSFLWQWHRVLELEESIRRADEDQLRNILRFRMNPHKVTHPHYQHVDGTSVSAPQVAAVAAQMLEANPSLTAYRVKELIMESALPLQHLDRAHAGAGLLQPSTAVALAQRDRGGPLHGLPLSGTAIGQGGAFSAHPAQSPGRNSGHSVGLRDLPIPIKVDVVNNAFAHFNAQFSAQSRQIHGSVASGSQQMGYTTAPVYIGIHAPGASAVSMIGPFNNWQPGEYPLYKARNQWWHGLFHFPPGVFPYRLWIVDQIGRGHWAFDHENPVREESGYSTPHSSITV